MTWPVYQPHLGSLPSRGIPAPLGVQRGSWEEQGRGRLRDGCRLPEDPPPAETMEPPEKQCRPGANPSADLEKDSAFFLMFPQGQAVKSRVPLLN